VVSELKTILIAASPLVELRGAIPLALKVYHLPLWSAVVFSLIGNLAITCLLLLFLAPFSRYLSAKCRLAKSFFEWLFEKARRSHEKSFRKWEDFALFLFVAIPLPFTGAWSAALCAFLFRVKFKQAFSLIGSGLLVAAIFITLLTLFVF